MVSGLRPVRHEPRQAIGHKAIKSQQNYDIAGLVVSWFVGRAVVWSCGQTVRQAGSWNRQAVRQSARERVVSWSMGNKVHPEIGAKRHLEVPCCTTFGPACPILSFACGKVWACSLA